MPSIKIALKVTQLTDGKVKFKLKIESNAAKSKLAANSAPEVKKPGIKELISDESLPLFDCPAELEPPSLEQPSFWKWFPAWLKFRRRGWK
jgi:hypothetical protein